MTIGVDGIHQRPMEHQLALAMAFTTSSMFRTVFGKKRKITPGHILRNAPALASE
ncbi:MAG: hypothetical protein O7D97_09290 [Planctomycetota bacterium]|nr:hypothetical protein [Planctomycetota bacterium]